MEVSYARITRSDPTTVGSIEDATSEVNDLRQSAHDWKVAWAKEQELRQLLEQQLSEYINNK